MNDDSERPTEDIKQKELLNSPISDGTNDQGEAHPESVIERLPNGKEVVCDPDDHELHRPAEEGELGSSQVSSLPRKAVEHNTNSEGPTTEILSNGKTVEVVPEDGNINANARRTSPPAPAARKFIQYFIPLAVTCLLALLVILYLVRMAYEYGQQLKAVDLIFLDVYYAVLLLLAVCLLVFLMQKSYRYWRLISLEKLSQNLMLAEQGRHLANTSDSKIRKQIDCWVEGLKSRDTIAASAGDLVREKLDDADSVEHWIIVLREHLLPSLDELVKTAIEKEARAVGIATALSPYGFVDAIVVLWRNSRLILRIAEIYGGRPNWWDSLKMQRKVLGNVLFAGASQEMLNLFFKHAVAGFFAKGFGYFGGATLQGLLTGGMTIRVGIAAQEICRLLPMTESETKDRLAGQFSTLRGILFRKNKETPPDSAGNDDGTSEEVDGQRASDPRNSNLR